MSTGIGKEWSALAKGWLGYADGRHCHWCGHILSEDGEATCNNPESKYFDGDRIRSWDARGCAMDCGLFSLSEWYRDDNNLKEMRANAKP